MIWTAIWTPEISRRHPLLALRFTGQREVALADGKQIMLYRHEYGATSITRRFWGGNRAYSEWMSREGLVLAAEAAGYRVSEVAFDEPGHRNAPSLAMLLVPAGSF